MNICLEKAENADGNSDTNRWTQLAYDLTNFTVQSKAHAMATVSFETKMQRLFNVNDTLAYEIGCPRTFAFRL